FARRFDRNWFQTAVQHQSRSWNHLDQPECLSPAEAALHRSDGSQRFLKRCLTRSCDGDVKFSAATALRGRFAKPRPDKSLFSKAIERRVDAPDGMLVTGSQSDVILN